MDLSIIIINFKTPELTIDCINSVLASNGAFTKEIIIIDNASDDGSAEKIAIAFPNLKYIQTDTNLGFAGANNLAAKTAIGEYLLLLNSDTKVGQDTLSMLHTNAQKVSADIASCQLLNLDGSIQPQGGALPSLWNLACWMWFLDDIPGLSWLCQPYQQRNTSFFTQDQNIGWLGGTALLVKKTVYDQLEGLDDNIFMYAEDVDFCYRAEKMGFSIKYFAQPQVIHLGQASGSKQASILGEYKGLRYFFKKHKSRTQVLVLRALLWSGAMLRWLIFGKILGHAEKETIYWKAMDLA